MIETKGLTNDQIVAKLREKTKAWFL
jgi:hypothetical protein